MAQCTPKSFDLTGKVALITGASYGIGMKSPFPALARQVFLPQVRLKYMLILKAIWLVKELLFSAPATSEIGRAHV